MPKTGAKPARISANTARLYSTAEIAFDKWREEKRLQHPLAYDEIANYLRDVAKERGPSAVPVHMSVIGRLYRQRGWPVDTKAPVLQSVIKAARRRIGPW